MRGDEWVRCWRHEYGRCEQCPSVPAREAANRAAIRALPTDPDVVRAVQWRLDHYGPRDAKPFEFSKYESEAHAALSAVDEAIRAVLDNRDA